MKKTKLATAFLLVFAMFVALAAVCITQVSADSLASITVAPQTIGSDTINPGGTAHYIVSVSGTGGATWDLSIATTTLPSGYTAVFTPNPITSATGTATLAITTPSTITPSSYSFTVHCSDPSDGHPAGNSASTQLAVIAFALPEYSIGALAALGACFAALLVYKRKSLSHLNIRI